MFTLLVVLVCIAMTVPLVHRRAQLKREVCELNRSSLVLRDLIRELQDDKIAMDEQMVRLKEEAACERQAASEFRRQVMDLRQTADHHRRATAAAEAMVRRLADEKLIATAREHA